MKKALLKKVGLYTGILLSGVSGYALMQNVAHKCTSDFTKTNVVIAKDTIPIQQFYYNLSYTEEGWIYTNPQGQIFNVDSLCDYHHRENRKQEGLRNLKLKTQIDTIYVSYDKGHIKSRHKPKIIYKNEYADSLPHMPSMGLYNYDVITIREFKADTPELQKKVDIYNNRYNCTFDHEYSHYLNAINGIRTWNSYPIKFVECCLDEVAVNIKQCLSQRKNYLDNGRDIQFITNRFDFYKNALQNGSIKPLSHKLTEDEAQFIANSIFDTWMKDKFSIYTNQECSRTEYFLKDAPYPAVLGDTTKHNAVMQKVFTIDNVDFWKYISLREQEIFDKIPSEKLAKWQKLTEQKSQNMTYFENLELLKVTQGERAYHKTLNENKIKARIISAFGKDR